MNVKQIEQDIFEDVLSALNKAQTSESLLSREDLRKRVEQYFEFYKNVHTLPDKLVKEVNFDILVERLNIEVAIKAEDSTSIVLKHQHIDWLSSKRHLIEDGTFWVDYRNYLLKRNNSEKVKKWDASTDKILSHIEDPDRIGSWSSKGLVIGDVQSGKTTNFLGVVAKALDVGYDIVIILSGMHNSLRFQTQKRFEEGITGFNTTLEEDVSKECGIGSLLKNKPDRGKKHRLPNWTNRDRDFLESNDPGVFEGYSVNKKVKGPLENLIRHIKRYIPEGQTQHNNKRLLLIDDEADNASVNTKKKISESSTINRLIRELLSLFSRSAYIGYTATPFANTLIDVDNTDDLFPRNFIHCIGRSDNYIGPKEVFGTLQDEVDSKEAILESSERETSLKWFRNLDDQRAYCSDWIEAFPDKHDKYLDVKDLPNSMTDSILSFLVATAIRQYRGQNKEHGTMLIHVTRFKDVQSQIYDLVLEFVESLYNEIAIKQHAIGTQKRLSRAFELFKSDFNSKEISKEDLEEQIRFALGRLRQNVFTINGDYKDVIDEDRYPNGLISIRIGGDKLSRGLTLPNLTTSYFLRCSRMYDTLMQMGRWFGYRDGYKDLCRLYTTGRLYNWYGHVSLALENLRDRIISMDKDTLTPLDYQQQILSHPGMMLVTATNKQYRSRKMDISFADTYIEMTGFDVSIQGQETQKNNLNLIEETINAPGFPDGEIVSSNTIFKGISSKSVRNFINKFKVDEKVSPAWKKNLIIDYIKQMNKIEELESWTVVLYSRSRGDNIQNLGKYSARPLERKNQKEGTSFLLSARNLTSANDERLDLTERELQEVINEVSPNKPKREDYRKKRSNKNGLFIIYLLDGSIEETSIKDLVIPACAISFPKSANAKRTTYVVNLLDDVEEELEFEYEDE